MQAKRIQKKVNGYRISWCETHQVYNIRKNGKLIATSGLLSMAVELCKQLPKAS